MFKCYTSKNYHNHVCSISSNSSGDYQLDKDHNLQLTQINSLTDNRHEHIERAVCVFRKEASPRVGEVSALTLLVSDDGFIPLLGISKFKLC